MRYLITYNMEFPNDPFLTDWFNSEDNFQLGMIVYDLRKRLYTDDGIIWKDIKEDVL